MKLLLTNVHTDGHREVEVNGNPLLTFEYLRAGDGLHDREGGHGQTVLYWSRAADRWVLDIDRSVWTDVEVVEL